jgi:predicted transcriptional regulator
MRSKENRRQSVEQYLAARQAFDAHTERIEADRDAGRPAPVTEDEDTEYQTLNEALYDARSAAPWWARLRWP